MAAFAMASHPNDLNVFDSFFRPFAFPALSPLFANNFGALNVVPQTIVLRCSQTYKYYDFQIWIQSIWMGSREAHTGDQFFYRSISEINDFQK